MTTTASSGDITVADDPSFEAFFSVEFTRLAQALFLLTGSSSEAEELAQEAMVRVYERWGRVSTMDSPTGYLFRTALNLHRSALRGLVRRVREGAEGAPTDVISAADERDALSRALATIPVGQRQALILVEWLSFTPDEAGQVLGIAAGSVRVRVSRAKNALRSLGGMDDG
jgi:RNA polymerase sigma-70 factor, ECF subfamily